MRFTVMSMFYVLYELDERNSTDDARDEAPGGGEGEVDAEEESNA